MDLITLADLPELAGTDAKPRTTIVIGRLDDNLRDPRYGKFAITQRQVDGWKRNLADTFGGQVSMDFDHSSDRGQGTKAACWIRGIGQEGKMVTADVQFTRAGAKAVRNGDYKYTSPTFVEDYVDEHGVKHGPALIGGALTNRPVLRKGMPTLSLSRDELDGVATASDDQSAKRERERARTKLARMHSDSEPARDSRRQMDPAKLAQLLDLSEDADEATILAKVEELKAAPAPTPAEPAPTPEGTLTLSAERVADLEARANAGAAAATQLAEQTFTHAWEKALSEGRAAPSQEETMRELYRHDSALALKTLDSFVQIVPTTPKGSGDGPPTEAPNGMDLDRFTLHTEAKALADQKVKANPTLDPGEAYALSAIEIEERNFALGNPGI